MEKTAYAPGESGEIKAYFSTGTFSGHVSKTIRVLSNTKGNDIVRLSFTADVVSDLKPATTSLYFRDVLPGQEYQKDVFIQNNMDQPLEIRDIRVHGDQKIKHLYPLRVNLKKNKDGLEYLTFTLKPDMKMDDIVMQQANFNIEVATNAVKSPTMKFYVIVRMQHPIEIQPTSLFLYGTRSGQKRIRRIQLKSNMGKPLTITDIQCDNKWLKFETVKESDTITHIWVGTKEISQEERDGAHNNLVYNDIVHIKLMAGDEEKTFSVTVRGSMIP